MGRWVRGSGRLGLLVAGAVASLASASTSYQSARTMPAGTIEGGAAVTFIGEATDALATAEVMLRGGVSDRSEVGIKMAVLPIPGTVPAATFRLDWKYALVRDHVALDLPIAFIAAGSSAAPYTDPTLLLGAALGPYLEVDGGLKVLLGGGGYAPGAHMGFRLSSDLDSWAVHPEIGALFDPEGNGFVVHFGVALIGRLGDPSRPAAGR